MGQVCCLSDVTFILSRVLQPSNVAQHIVGFSAPLNLGALYSGYAGGADWYLWHLGVATHTEGRVVGCHIRPIACLVVLSILD